MRLAQPERTRHGDCDGALLDYPQALWCGANLATIDAGGSSVTAFLVLNTSYRVL
jgi:hypothetical protein